MDATQYVHVDVSSYAAVEWTFYYTHHSDMDALQYVHAYVHSNDVCH
jgi:hypothetical protein